MNLSIIFLGDINGAPGRRAVFENLKSIVDEFEADFVIANGENSAGGHGITPKIAKELKKTGIDVITSGDHIWDQKIIMPFLDECDFLLRPANFSHEAPGRGFVKVEKGGKSIGVINLLGQTFMGPNVENPFNFIDELLKKMQDCDVIFIDFHAETTSEKVAFARYVDGLNRKVSAVVGTHTHVQTGEEEIFENGTAFLCDAGMCGPSRSVIGRDLEPVIRKFKTSLPHKFTMAKGLAKICGVCINVDTDTAKATKIQPFRKNYP